MQINTQGAKGYNQNEDNGVKHFLLFVVRSDNTLLVNTIINIMLLTTQFEFTREDGAVPYY